MIGIEHRLQAFINPSDRRALIIDTSAGLSLGALSGLENFVPSARAILPHANGIVCSPGQITKLTHLDKQDAGLLVRMDWNNTLRPDSFALPVTTPHRVPILSAQDALDLGASGMVITFLLGYEEALEADCLQSTVQLALEGKALGLPLVVEVQSTGPRVSLPAKAVELGVSYALEGGADVIVLPHPGTTSLKTISQFCSVPWLVKPAGLDTARAILPEILDLGGSGLWLDHELFSRDDPAEVARDLMERLHKPVSLVR